MNESQRRAFDALGLGPAWRLRRSGDAEDGNVEGGSTERLPAIESPAAAAPVCAALADDASAGREPIAAVPVAIVRPDAMPPASRSAEASRPAEASQIAERPASADGAIESLDWDALERRVAGCRSCGLCESRRQTVFGVGPHEARWMIIGEAPGAEEDAQGEPFVGQAGRLLDSMLASIGLSRRQQVFIANVLKCRPPRNRNPEASEVASCSPYLRRQMALLDPAIIVLMGKFAASTMLGVDTSVGKLRGHVHRIAVNGRQVPAIVTYHPAYLLRDLTEKAKAWRDLQMALREYRGSRRDEPPRDSDAAGQP